MKSTGAELPYVKCFKRWVKVSDCIGSSFCGISLSEISTSISWNSFPRFSAEEPWETILAIVNWASSQDLLVSDENMKEKIGACEWRDERLIDKHR